MASRGVRRARSGHGVRHVRHLGHRLQLGRQFPGHPGAGRVELPPAPAAASPRWRPVRRGAAVTDPASATLALVGDDARYAAEHIAGRNPRGSSARCGSWEMHVRARDRQRSLGDKSL